MSADVLDSNGGMGPGDDAAVSWTGRPLPSIDHDLLMGSTLHETYIVDRVIGEGGMGRVYEARHTRIPNKRFAIKVLHPEYAGNPNLQARFQREAEAAASVDHPSVVGIYDVGCTPQGWPYMVCEHLSGIDLHSHIKNAAPLPLAMVVHIGRRLCDALAAAHAQGVIHRDLKPHNVFLVGDFSQGIPQRPQIKVLDFGLSRFVDQDSQLTKTGVVMGTPAYMSPEQARAHPTDHRTDIYGVGAILYSAATGRPPFQEETPQMTVLAVMGENPPPRPRSIEPSVSEALEVVIQRAMAKEPSERFQNMSQLHAALNRLEVSPALSVLPPGPGKSSAVPISLEEARAARLRLGLLFAAALGLTLALVSSSIVGLAKLSGRELSLSTTELVLLLALGLACTFPAFLLWRRFRAIVWPNSAKVVAWLPKWRAPMFAALFAYGLGSLVVRVADDIVFRFITRSGGGGNEWPGWSLVLACIALIAASAAVVRQRWYRPRRGLRSWLFGPILTAAATVGSLAVLAWGVQWRSQGILAPAVQVTRAPIRGEQPAPKAASVPPLATGATPVKPSVKVSQRAPDDLLAAAIAEGAEGLTKLSRRYPDDPELLRSLVLAHASRGTTLIDAVEAAKHLFDVAPEQRRDPDIRYILTKAAQGKAPESEAAFSVMREHMGTSGADVLYDLMLRKPSLDKQARTALADLRRRGQFSPALAIAYDLRFARSCSGRLPLLPRAAELGDERSTMVLVALSSKPPECRRRRRVVCKPRCEQEAKDFIQTIERISERLQAAKSSE